MLREQGSRRIVHLGRVLLRMGIFQGSFAQLLSPIFTYGGHAIMVLGGVHRTRSGAGGDRNGKGSRRPARPVSSTREDAVLYSNLKKSAPKFIYHHGPAGILEYRCITNQ